MTRRLCLVLLGLLALIVIGAGPASGADVAWSGNGHSWSTAAAPITGPVTLYAPSSPSHDVEVRVIDSTGNANGNAWLTTPTYFAVSGWGDGATYDVPAGVTVYWSVIDFGPYDSDGGGTANSDADYTPDSLGPLVALITTGGGSLSGGSGSSGSDQGPDVTDTLMSALGSLSSPSSWAFLLGYGLVMAAAVFALWRGWLIARRVL